MLQKFRDNLKGVTAFILVGIIIVPFALFGIDSLFLQGSSGKQVAEVDGQEILEQQLLQGIEARKRQLQARFGELDPGLLDDEQLREPVLESLIRQVAVAQAAKSSDMGISPQTFTELVRNVPAFQREGKFDTALYQFAVNQMGYTTKTYRQRVEEELLVNQYISGVLDSEFLAAPEVDRFANLTLQTRDFHYLKVPVTEFMGEVKVDEKEIDDYYSSHTELFQVPEQVVIEYISLGPEDLSDAVEVDEDMLLDYYQQHISLLQQKTTWSLAHIFLEDEETADEKVAEIQSELEAGVPFEDLAKEFSEDFGSASQGGNLGNFTLDSLPDGFELAVKGMSPGEVTGPVKSTSGVHFIKLLDKSVTEIPAFETEREQLLTELTKQLALEQLPERVEALKEKSYNMASLAEVAEDLDLDFKVSPPFSRRGGEGIAAIPQIIQAAFSEDVLLNGYASDVLEVTENNYVVIKLKEHFPAHRQSLVEVKTNVIELLKREKAMELASNEADMLLSSVAAGKSIEDAALETDREWQVSLQTSRFDNSFDQELIAAVFKPSPNTSLPVSDKVRVANGDFVVYALNRIHAGNLSSLSDQEVSNLKTSLAQGIATREWQSYEADLVKLADVSR